MIRYGYVYAIAQHDTGNRKAALRTLRQMQTRYPANPEITQLLTTYRGHAPPPKPQ